MTDSTQVIATTSIYFIQAGISAIKIGCSLSPPAELIRLDDMSPEPCKLLASFPGTARELLHLYDLLEKHHIRHKWFEPAPEVIALVHRGLPSAVADVGQKRRKKGGRKLTRDQVVECFYLCHTTSASYRRIGARYGIGEHAVGRIARGVAYAELFDKEYIAGTYDYWVSEQGRENAAKFRMHQYVRGRKARGLHERG